MIVFMQLEISEGQNYWRKKGFLWTGLRYGQMHLTHCIKIASRLSESCKLQRAGDNLT